MAHEVRRLVLLSGRGEEEAQECELIIQRPDIDWTVVRCSWFSQNFSEGESVRHCPRRTERVAWRRRPKGARSRASRLCRRLWCLGRIRRVEGTVMTLFESRGMDPLLPVVGTMAQLGSALVGGSASLWERRLAAIGLDQRPSRRDAAPTTRARR